MKLDESFIAKVEADHKARGVEPTLSAKVIDFFLVELRDVELNREIVRARHMLNGLIDDPDDPLTKGSDVVGR